MIPFNPPSHSHPSNVSTPKATSTKTPPASSSQQKQQQQQQQANSPTDVAVSHHEQEQHHRQKQLQKQTPTLPHEAIASYAAPTHQSYLATAVAPPTNAAVLNTVVPRTDRSQLYHHPQQQHHGSIHLIATQPQSSLQPPTPPCPSLHPHAHAPSAPSASLQSAQQPQQPQSQQPPPQSQPQLQTHAHPHHSYIYPVHHPQLISPVAHVPIGAAHYAHLPPSIWSPPHGHQFQPHHQPTPLHSIPRHPPHLSHIHSSSQHYSIAGSPLSSRDPNQSATLHQHAHPHVYPHAHQPHAHHQHSHLHPHQQHASFHHSAQQHPSPHYAVYSYPPQSIHSHGHPPPPTPHPSAQHPSQSLPQPNSHSKEPGSASQPLPSHHLPVQYPGATGPGDLRSPASHAHGSTKLIGPPSPSSANPAPPSQASPPGPSVPLNYSIVPIGHSTGSTHSLRIPISSSTANSMYRNGSHTPYSVVNPNYRHHSRHSHKHSHHLHHSTSQRKTGSSSNDVHPSGMRSPYGVNSNENSNDDDNPKKSNDEDNNSKKSPCPKSPKSGNNSDGADENMNSEPTTTQNDTGGEGNGSGSGSGSGSGFGSGSGSGSGSGQSLRKPRKPYTITKSREVWTKEEHSRFLSALEMYDRDWKKIEAYIGTKSVLQIRSHAQKHFGKVTKYKTGEYIPPPRPKKRATLPYPRSRSMVPCSNKNNGANSRNMDASPSTNGRGNGNLSGSGSGGDGVMGDSDANDSLMNGSRSCETPNDSGTGTDTGTHHRRRFNKTMAVDAAGLNSSTRNDENKNESDNDCNDKNSMETSKEMSSSGNEQGLNAETAGKNRSMSNPMLSTASLSPRRKPNATPLPSTDIHMKGTTETLRHLGLTDDELSKKKAAGLPFTSDGLHRGNETYGNRYARSHNPRTTTITNAVITTTTVNKDTDQNINGRWRNTNMNNKKLTGKRSSSISRNSSIHDNNIDENALQAFSPKRQAVQGIDGSPAMQTVREAETPDQERRDEKQKRADNNRYIENANRNENQRQLDASLLGANNSLLVLSNCVDMMSRDLENSVTNNNRTKTASGTVTTNSWEGGSSSARRPRPKSQHPRRNVSLERPNSTSLGNRSTTMYHQGEDEENGSGDSDNVTRANSTHPRLDREREEDEVQAIARSGSGRESRQQQNDEVEEQDMEEENDVDQEDDDDVQLNNPPHRSASADIHSRVCAHSHTNDEIPDGDSGSASGRVYSPAAATEGERNNIVSAEAPSRSRSGSAGSASDDAIAGFTSSDRPSVSDIGVGSSCGGSGSGGSVDNSDSGSGRGDVEVEDPKSSNDGSGDDTLRQTSSSRDSSPADPNSSVSRENSPNSNTGEGGGGSSGGNSTAGDTPVNTNNNGNENEDEDRDAECTRNNGNTNVNSNKNMQRTRPTMGTSPENNRDDPNLCNENDNGSGSGQSSGNVSNSSSGGHGKVTERNGDRSGENHLSRQEHEIGQGNENGSDNGKGNRKETKNSQTNITANKDMDMVHNATSTQDETKCGERGTCVEGASVDGLAPMSHLSRVNEDDGVQGNDYVPKRVPVTKGIAHLLHASTCDDRVTVESKRGRTQMNIPDSKMRLCTINMVDGGRGASDSQDQEMEDMFDGPQERSDRLLRDGREFREKDVDRYSSDDRRRRNGT